MTDDSFLDRLTGRDDLKAYINELEAELDTVRSERDQLEEQLEAMREKRSNAVTEKQRAFEERNRLQDRVAELEDRIDTMGEDEAGEFERELYEIPEYKVDDIVNALQAIQFDRDVAYTAYIDDHDSLPEHVTDCSDRIIDGVRRSAPALVLLDDYGLTNVALEPPYPTEPFEQWDTSFAVDSAHLCPPQQYTFAVVSADTFCAAVFEDGSITSFTKHESNVKSKHKKGGFSQSRFERLRDEQIREHVTTAREQLDEISVDPLFVVGQEEIVSQFEDDAVHVDTTDVRGASRQAVQDARADFWSTRVWSL